MLAATHRCLTWQVMYHYLRQQKRYRNAPTALRDTKPKSKLKNTMNTFIDWKKLRAIGGDGGDGKIAFLRIFANDRAGPAGGDGGNGGHVIVMASKGVHSLSHIESWVKAENGEEGMIKDCHGKSAEHTILEVPVGTLIKTEDNQVYDLMSDGNMVIVARGGAGGRGNHYFTTATNQTPKIAEKGGKGESRSVLLEMRVIADVGLIGFPNAGKSTFLRAVSRARPRVASYPFTTLQPYIGMVLYDDHKQVAVADIPGLIVDSHKNRGLGISFLRHIQRCRCLLYILDLAFSPCEQFESLKYELEQFQPGLSQRPSAIIANKIDLEEAQQQLEKLKQIVSVPIFPVSAKFGTNLSEVLAHIRMLYDKFSDTAVCDL